MENSEIHLRFQNYRSSKYYKVAVEEESRRTWRVVCRYGRIGAWPQINYSHVGLADRSAAVIKAQEQIAQKIHKGYEIYKGAVT